MAEQGEGEKEGAGQRGTWFPPFPERAEGKKVRGGWAKSLPWGGFSGSTSGVRLVSVLWGPPHFLWHRKASLPLAMPNLFPGSGLCPLGHSEGRTGGGPQR